MQKVEYKYKKARIQYIRTNTFTENARRAKCGVLRNKTYLYYEDYATRKWQRSLTAVTDFFGDSCLQRKIKYKIRSAEVVCKQFAEAGGIPLFRVCN